MNNKRAIELLHRLQDEQFDGKHGDERREALEMAVKALEGDGDTISRQATIDEVINLWADKPFGNPTLVEIKECIEALPPAQPTQINADPMQGSALDCVRRQQAIEELMEHFKRVPTIAIRAKKVIEKLQPAQPEDYTELKREFLRMASYIDVLLECSDEQKETLVGFISRLAEFMPWTERD